jgi:hypothetical protein
MIKLVGLSFIILFYAILLSSIIFGFMFYFKILDLIKMCKKFFGRKKYFIEGIV